MSGNIGSESAMRIIWESMGLEWPGRDFQENSQKVPPCFQESPRRGKPKRPK